jgi:hypothetical protein
MPLAALVTVPHSKGPDPMKTWFTIGSKVAEISAGLTVMRLAENGEQFRVQLTVDPERVYWDNGQPELVVQFAVALSHPELPAFVQ